MEEMNLFGSVEHNDDNTDKWVELPDNPTNQDMLDYMVLVIARYVSCDKAFKGGYMLNQLLPSESRMTHDADFSIAKKEDYDEIKNILVKIAQKFKKNGLIKTYKVKDEITETSSGGIDIYDMQGVKILGVDVGLHDISWGVKSYDFKIVTSKAFEVERMLSDKVTAITTRKRFRRTKDLYDVFVITSNFDFDYKKLQQYVAMHDTVQWENLPFSEEILVQYEHAWDKLILTNMLGENLNKPAFNIVLKRYYDIAMSLKYDEIHEKWQHTLLSWR
ncbi:MAG: nucleotidyl transferase AbiEii/AbiGii toxin family protein [Clostridium sp.]|nr:nucleotidyl transferase AbiEii/AbiGii toxin family protein [Clostridium sp.]MCM1207507.1 nucleotidyl transferase AbiEii/AbiGii toxin family protein [Ruminococcus sp.]